MATRKPTQAAKKERPEGREGGSRAEVPVDDAENHQNGSRAAPESAAGAHPTRGNRRAPTQATPREAWGGPASELARKGAHP
jgi:hypothetical protein